MKRKCIAKYKGGSTIEWARCTAAELQEGVTTVFQTGINNILNTRQSNNNIIHQFKMLTREGVSRGNTVIITSILPTDIGPNVDQRVEEINAALSKIVEREGGIFIDMTKYFIENGRIVEQFYRYERGYERDGFLHLNAGGASIMARKINQIIQEYGGSEIIEDFWEPSRINRHW